MQVLPYDGADAGGVLSLKDMDPDFDGDGKISPLEKAVYDKMLAADVDGDGLLTRAEVYKVIQSMKHEVDDAVKGGIPISTLNPVRRPARSKLICAPHSTSVALDAPASTWWGILRACGCARRTQTATARLRSGRRTSTGASRPLTRTRAARSA